MAIKFNNKTIPSFVKVNDVKVSALPTISQTLLKVNGRAGSYDFGNTIGDREIEVTVSIIADSPSDLKDKIRAFSEWLYTEDARELVILDDSTRYYMAKITGESEISEVLKVGQGTISFICTDPYAYGYEKSYDYNPTESIPYPFYNSGAVETFPQMSFEFTQDTPSFTILSDDEQLIFGQSAEVGLAVSDPNPIIMSEDFSALNGWSTASKIDDGVVSGTFKSNGYSISLDDVGTGTKWHGASLIKGLSKQVQDFKIQANIGLLADKIGQLGRVQVYFLDVNGNQVGNISLRNGNPTGITPYAQARLGSKEIVATYGDYKGVWKNFNNGYMEVERKGNIWTFSYAIYDADKKVSHTRYQKQYVDIDNLFNTKIAQVQIHIGAYGEAPLIPLMFIGDLKVWSLNEAVQSNTVSKIIKKGDVLFIDNETGAITLNGADFYEKLDPTSRFIRLNKGDNGLILSPANITTNGVIRYKERWL